MRVNRLLILSAFLLLSFHISAQQPVTLSPTVQKYVRVNTAESDSRARARN